MNNSKRTESLTSYRLEVATHVIFPIVFMLVYVVAACGVGR